MEMESENENENIEEPQPPPPQVLTPEEDEITEDQILWTRSFAVQGLHNLCDLVPFSELKKLRLICPQWNDVATRHPRFRFSHAHFTNDWNSSTKKFYSSVEKMAKWQFITMRFFPVHRNTIFWPYWAQAGPIVQTLNLDSVRVGCMEMCKIVNWATALKSVTFTRMNFDAEENLRPTKGVQGAGHDNGDGQGEEPMPTTDNPIYNVYCNHESCDDLLLSQDGQVIGRPTIKKISISFMESFPLCLLDLLQRRSSGVLEDFSVLRLIEGEDTTRKVYPSMDHMHPHILRICRANRATLKSLCWARNQKKPNLIEILGQEVEGNNNWNLEKLTLAMARHNERRWAVSRRERPIFWGWITSQAPWLVELNIALSLTPNSRNSLVAMIPLLVNLRKVKLQVDNIDENMPRDVNFFQTSPALTDLTIVDTSVKLTEDIPHWGWGHQETGISLEHMSHLPMSIRKLTCAHRARFEPHLHGALNHPNLLMLTTLVILDGTRIRDETFQLIIRKLSLLQVLKFTHGRFLTDAGVTGMTLRACQILNRCQKHELWLKEPKPGTQTGVSLRELVHLRELDMSHCTKLTDVSLCHAFRFPELRKLVLDVCLNMGGLGLSYVGLHNPKLHTLQVFGCPKVSHIGLNRLVAVAGAKSLRKIITSECNTRPGPTATYTEHPLFHEIVTIHKYTPRLPTEERKHNQQRHIDQYIF